MRKPLSFAMRNVESTAGSCYTCQEPGAQRAHYEAFVGNVPEGWTVRHDYRTKWSATCVNPEHLVPVTATKQKVARPKPVRKPQPKRAPGETRRKAPSSHGLLVNYEGKDWSTQKLADYLDISWSRLVRNLVAGMTAEEAIAATPNRTPRTRKSLKQQVPSPSSTA